MSERNAAALIALIVCLAACGDYEIALPHGYKIGRIYSGAFVIANSQNRVVAPESHGGMRATLIGDVFVAEIDYAAAPAPASRFFIVNTQTNEVWSNLSREELRQRLERLAIHRVPQLLPVTRFTTMESLRTAA